MFFFPQSRILTWTLWLHENSGDTMILACKNSNLKKKFQKKSNHTKTQKAPPTQKFEGKTASLSPQNS